MCGFPGDQSPRHRHIPELLGVAVTRIEVRNYDIGDVSHRYRRSCTRTVGFVEADSLLGVPRLSNTARAVDGSGHRHPRVEWCDRSIRTQDDVGSGVDERAEGERDVGTAGPMPVCDIAVVDSVLRLYACRHAECCKSRQVCACDQLSVFDHATDANGVESIEGDSVCMISDGVNGRHQPNTLSLSQERNEFSRRIPSNAMCLRPRLIRVRVVAKSCSGVERTISDDLEWTNRDTGSRSVENGASPITIHLCPVEVLGIDSGADPDGGSWLVEDQAPPYRMALLK